MSSIEFFSPPDGDTLTNPDRDWLKKLVVEPSRNYWNSGAGQASLKWHGDNGATELLLVFDQDHGFSLEYIDQNKVYYVPLGDGDFDHTVKVYVGGEPVVLPTKFFVSKERTWVAVEQFLKDGNRSNDLNWARRSELKWHYGYP
jgi:hypothetical protein